MTGVGGATWDTATPISAGETSPESPVNSYPTSDHRAFWKITSATTTNLAVDILLSTVTGNSLMLYVLSGDTEATSEQVGYDRNTGTVTFTADAGVTYHIQVSTYFSGSTPGGYVLRVVDQGPPAPPVLPSANDNFSAAAALTPGQTSAPANSAGNTLESGEPNPGGNGKTAWWSFTAPTDGTVKVDTYYSDTATLLGIYTGTSVSALTQLATATSSGTGRAACNVTVTAGTTYYVQVDTPTSVTAANLSVSATYLGGASAGPIGLGSPDAYIYGNPSKAQGGTLANVEDNTGVTGTEDHRPIMSAHSSAPAGAMSDSDTGSYVSLDNPGFNADMVATYSRGPYYLSAMGRLDASPDIPANFDQIFVTLTMTARSSTSDHSFEFDVLCYDASENSTGLPGVTLPQPAATTAWATTTTTETALASSTAGAVETTRQNLNARRLTVMVLPRWTPTYAAPTGIDDVAYLAMTFRWTTYDRPLPYGFTLVRTWVREVQRGGDKAGAPIRTVQNNSQQASLRNIAFR